jgi:hypothetical protein
MRCKFGNFMNAKTTKDTATPLLAPLLSSTCPAGPARRRVASTMWGRSSGFFQGAGFSLHDFLDTGGSFTTINVPVRPARRPPASTTGQIVGFLRRGTGKCSQRPLHGEEGFWHGLSISRYYNITYSNVLLHL